LNMGIIGTFGGYYLHKTIRVTLGRRRWMSMATATVVAAWVSVVAAAIMTAIQLSLSETVPLMVAMIAMVSWHILIGIGEAIITLIAVSFIWRSRPDLLYDPPVPYSVEINPNKLS
jgi:cobalt/nickel transport system permease protein